MESADMETCRLCFSDDFSDESQLIDIFTEFGLYKNIAEIINEHIGEVCETDVLPKTVCKSCWKKTEEFHVFHRFVQSAQAEFLNRAVKTEETTIEQEEIQGQPNFVEVESIFQDVPEDFHEEINTKNIPTDVLETTSIEQNNDANDDESNVDEIEINCEKTESQTDDEDNDTLNEDSIIGDSDSENISCDETKPITTSESNKINEIMAKNFDMTCDVCSIDLKTLKNAVTHYKKEHKIDDGYIKCCGLKLKRENTVSDHIKYHINPNIFKCKYCQRTMKTKLSLSTHIANHRHAKQYICEICGKIFTQLNKIRNHMDTHAKSLVCKICSKRCLTKEKLERHLKFYHNPDDVKKQLDELREINPMALDMADVEKAVATHFDMSCDKCGYKLKSLQEAQFHYLNKHQVADGYIKCCGIRFKKNLNMNGHIMWHMTPELFRCCICGKELNTLIALRAHLRVHETRQTPQQNTCPECDRQFFGKHHLTRHLKLVHGLTNLSKRKKNLNAIQHDSSIMDYFDMKCDSCSESFTSLQHAKLHYFDAHNIIDGYIKCCDMKFRELKNVNDHLKFHQNPDIFNCTFCGKNFPRKADLSAHLSQHKAVDTKKFNCDICNKAWKSKYRLDLHKKSHGEKTQRNFPCSGCNRKFATEKLRKSHIERIHQTVKGVKSEICEVCAKTFSTRKEVTAHVRAMHSENSIRRERVQCEICSAWLSNRYTLKEHMLRHKSEPRPCPQCDKVSPNQHALLCHIREVHTERSHKCHLCEKTFKAAVALKDHVATHTGEKMYKCSYCPEAFIWRPNMYSHQKKAHPTEWIQNRKRLNGLKISRRVQNVPPTK